MKAFLMKLLKNKVNNTLKSSDSKDSLAPLFKYLIFGGSGFTFFFLGFIVLIVVVFSPVFLASEYFNNDDNKVVAYDLCGDTCGENEQKFYSKLEEVRASYKSKGVNIDTNLISGTVFYGSTLNDEKLDTVDSGDDLVDDNKIHVSDVKSLASNMVSGSSIDYNKYRNYLVNTYIPKRFSHLYNNSDKDIMIQRIADDIMSYAEYNSNINIASSGSYVYEECSQVCSTDGQCLDLDEFVVRVVDHESRGFIDLTDNYAEQWKAQAIAARTYTLNVTDSCKKPVSLGANIDILDPNTNGSQHDRIAEAVKETSGQILTIDGKPILAMWDSFYKNNNYHCDDELCYATYQKISFNGEQYETHEVASYKKWSNYFLGGHGIGLNQYSAAYLADIGWKYDDIVKYFYDDRAELSTLKTVSTGSIVGGKYVSNAPLYNSSSEFFSNINYSYFASTSAMPDPQNYGECPWYAKGRAIELIAYSNMPDELKNTLMNSLRSTRGNGADWYSNPSGEFFEKSTDLYAARRGAIVSWSGGKQACAGGCGHVGIIEDVEYGSDGRAKRILMSEGWNGTGNPANASYSMKWWDIEAFRSYNSNASRTYRFNGYVYLLG